MHVWLYRGSSLQLHSSVFIQFSKILLVFYHLLLPPISKQKQNWGGGIKCTVAFSSIPVLDIFEQEQGIFPLLKGLPTGVLTVETYDFVQNKIMGKHLLCGLYFVHLSSSVKEAVLVISFTLGIAVATAVLYRPPQNFISFHTCNLFGCFGKCMCI